jgi:hypothetical protein
MQEVVSETLKIFVLVSILFVWVIRYANIVEEFKAFGYPAWLRDLVGIFKISFAVMLMSQSGALVKLGALGIAALMVCALLTHLKSKSPVAKMLPSATLLTINVFLYVLN